KIAQRFVAQCVKAASRGIRFELSVPSLGVELREPTAKRCQLLTGKPCDSRFDLFDRAHAPKLMPVLNGVRVDATGRASGEAKHNTPNGWFKTIVGPSSAHDLPRM